jgi:hypothetical protein
MANNMIFCSVVGLIPMKLRYAVMAFNVKCEEDETKFQWFDETIEGPLEVLEAQAEHKKGCELCMRSPTFGEVYFRCVALFHKSCFCFFY